MPLTRDDVQKLAELARLDLADDEIKAMQQDLGSILGFVDRLQKVDVRHAEPFTMPETAEWREDVAFPCDDVAREVILSNFPSRKGDLLATPGVFERPKGKK